MIILTQDHNNKVVHLHIEGLAGATRRGIRQGLFKAGRRLHKEFNTEVLRKPKSGRTYLVRRGKTRRRHVASAPGETPANLSGAYRRSAGFKLVGDKRLVFGAGSPKVPYAKWLEDGTRKMEPRPGLGNAVKASSKGIVNDIGNELRIAGNNL